MPVSINSGDPKSNITSKGLIISSYILKELFTFKVGESGSYNFIKPVSVIESNWALVISVVFPLPKDIFKSLTKEEALRIETNSSIFFLNSLSLMVLESNLISVLEGDISDIKNCLRCPLVKTFLWNENDRVYWPLVNP